MYSFVIVCNYVCVCYHVVCMFVCGGTPCTGSAFCATPSLRDKIDNNNNNDDDEEDHITPKRVVSCICQKAVAGLATYIAYWLAL